MKPLEGLGSGQQVTTVTWLASGSAGPLLGPVHQEGHYVQRLAQIVGDSTQGSQGPMVIGPNREHKDLKIGFLWSWLHCWLVFSPPPHEKGSYYGAQNGLELRSFLPQPSE